MKGMLIAQILILLVLVISWGVNLNKLTKCDFESPFKCEVIHAIGIVPVASVVTVWFVTEEKRREQE